MLGWLWQFKQFSENMEVSSRSLQVLKSPAEDRPLSVYSFGHHDAYFDSVLQTGHFGPSEGPTGRPGWDRSWASKYRMVNEPNRNEPSVNLYPIDKTLFFSETVPSLSSLFVLSIFRALECIQQYIRDKLKTKMSKTVTLATCKLHGVTRDVFVLILITWWMMSTHFLCC